MVCYNCGSPYHYSDKCPKPKKASTAKCHNCKQVGHKMDKCPQPRASSSSTCHRCKKPGHKQANCPEVEAKQSMCVVCLDTEPNWIFDSCHHLCVCEVCCLTLDECPMCRKVITSGGKVFKV